MERGRLLRIHTGLFWARWMHFTTSHRVSSSSVLILFSRLRLGLPSSLSLSVFQTKMWYVFILPPPTHACCTPIYVIHHCLVYDIWWRIDMWFSPSPLPLWNSKRSRKTHFKGTSSIVSDCYLWCLYFPPTSAEVKKMWMYIPTPIRLHGVVLN
jgi:hypothetical protein